MSATAPCKGTAEKESPPCIQCRYDTKNPGVETEASCARHTATWRRHKRLLAGTATADDMTLTRNLVALDDARIRANRVEYATIRAKIRKVECAKRQVDGLAASNRVECATIRAEIRKGECAKRQVDALPALDDARIRASKLECAQRQVDALPVEMLTRKHVAAAGVLALIRPDVFGETVKAHIKRADAYNRSCAADAPAETAAAAAAVEVAAAAVAAAAAAAEVGALCAAEASAAAHQAIPLEK